MSLPDPTETQSVVWVWVCPKCGDLDGRSGDAEEFAVCWCESVHKPTEMQRVPYVPRSTLEAQLEALADLVDAVTNHSPGVLINESLARARRALRQPGEGTDG